MYQTKKKETQGWFGTIIIAKFGSLAITMHQTNFDTQNNENLTQIA